MHIHESGSEMLRVGKHVSSCDILGISQKC